MKPAALIFSGYGLNCEEETKGALERVGATADIVHINELIAEPKRLQRYQIAIFPGGFSYGDDTGGGKAYARRVMNHVRGELETFLARDTLVAGICNGFQIVTNTGMLPGALVANDMPRYLCRWVDVSVVGESPWLSGLTELSLPIAHGEGKYVDTEANLDALESGGQVVLKYVAGPLSTHLQLSANPNGSMRDIAGIAGYGGRVLGLMPHPERATEFTHLPHWTYVSEALRREGKRVPTEGPGLQIFRNAVKYFA